MLVRRPNWPSKGRTAREKGYVFRRTYKAKDKKNRKKEHGEYRSESLDEQKERQIAGSGNNANGERCRGNSQKMVRGM